MVTGVICDRRGLVHGPLDPESPCLVHFRLFTLRARRPLIVGKTSRQRCAYRLAIRTDEHHNTMKCIKMLHLRPTRLIFDASQCRNVLISRRGKCTLILLYGLESCQLSNGDQHSLDFTYNRMCMKLFKSSNIDLVKEFHSYFIALCLV